MESGELPSTEEMTAAPTACSSSSSSSPPSISSPLSDGSPSQHLHQPQRKPLAERTMPIPITMTRVKDSPTTSPNGTSLDVSNKDFAGHTPYAMTAPVSQLRSSSGLTQLSSSSSLRSSGSVDNRAVNLRTLSGCAEIQTELSGGIQMQLASPLPQCPDPVKVQQASIAWEDDSAAVLADTPKSELSEAEKEERERGEPPAASQVIDTWSRGARVVVTEVDETASPTPDPTSWSNAKPLEDLVEPLPSVEIERPLEEEEMQESTLNLTENDNEIEDNVVAPIGGGSMLLAGWVTAHKQGLLNRTVRRWMALREMHIMFFTKPFGEELGCFHLYLAKVENPPQTAKLIISGAFLPRGVIEVTTASIEDAETWRVAVASTIERHSCKDVKPVLNRTLNNTNFNERQKLREVWLSEHLSNFYSTEGQDRSVDVDKVVQAFVFHELRLYMRMIGRYSNRSADLDFLLDPPEDTLPHSSDVFLKDDVAELMWRYHWLEGHLASFFQHYEPEQRKEASRIAAVHLGREDSLRCKLLNAYKGCTCDTQFLLDAPTMDTQGWRYSTESLMQSVSHMSEDESSAGQRRDANAKPATTILPNAFERWFASIAASPADPQAHRKRAKSVRFNLDRGSPTHPAAIGPGSPIATDGSPTKWFGKEGFATSIRQLLKIGAKEREGSDSKIK